MELTTLCDLPGVSGREELVRKAVLQACRDALGKEAVTIDQMGNIIAHKPGRNPAAPRKMVCAHMDEAGLMAVSATEEGLLRVRAIGNVDSRMLVSKRVQVGYPEDGSEPLNGVIGAMAIHLQTAEDRKHVLPIGELYVDIGARDKDEAIAKAPMGTPVTFAPGCVPFGENRLRGKALDGRTGCHNLLRLLSADVSGDTDFVFTTLYQVGGLGAVGAAYRLAPDAALVLDGSQANDLGDTDAVRRLCALGGGCVLHFMDRGAIAQPAFFAEMAALAKEASIPYQAPQVLNPAGEAGSVQLARGGAKTCVLSVPVRYPRTPISVVDLGDVEAQYQLARRWLEQ